MISISPYPYTIHKRSFKAVSNSFGANTNAILQSGDKALNENRANEALKSYLEAQKQEPNNTNINKKLAKAYHKLKDYKSAEQNFKIYLEKNPNDSEVWIDLGETQRQKGDYTNAISSFETALSLDNKNDLAKRSIMEAKNNALSVFSPQRAYEEKQKYAKKNLQEALQLTVNYMSHAFMKDLSDVQIKFGETASMGGTSNIAQYENRIKTITVSNAYKYASPVVIAAYIVHELVHAKDKDPYTSVREEQDAYQKATKFWIEHADEVEDPEMDYAAALYLQSPDTLNKRVEEIYVMRDPSIAKTSPNHPPQHRNFFHHANQTDAASQPIRSYNVIA